MPESMRFEVLAQRAPRFVPFFLSFTSCSYLLLTWKLWNEFAGGEIVQGAEAAGKLVKAQAAVAVEPAYKLDGRALGFMGVAIETTRDEIAVRVAAEPRLRDNVVEAPSLADETAQTIEAAATFAGVDGPAKLTGLEEVGFRETGVGGSSGGAASCGLGGAQSANFMRQPHINDMMGLAAAFKQAQDAARNQASHGLASRFLRQTNMASKPGHRKADAGPAFEAAMPEEMGIHGAVAQRKAELRSQQVFHLFPHLCGIEFFVGHRLCPRRRS